MSAGRRQIERTIDAIPLIRQRAAFTNERGTFRALTLHPTRIQAMRNRIVRMWETGADTRTLDLSEMTPGTAGEFTRVLMDAANSKTPVYVVMSYTIPIAWTDEERLQLNPSRLSETSSRHRRIVWTAADAMT